MPALEPSRYADGRAMHMAGVRRTHDYAGAIQGIPAQWEELHRLAPIPGRRGGESYGIICSAAPEERRFEYMCAVEVEGFDALPAGIDRLRVHPQRYAVFVHDGGADSIRATWGAIFGDWLPRSGHRPAHAPDFEIYGPDFDPATGRGTIEIWVPIEREVPDAR